MRLNREDIKNLLIDLNYLKDVDYHGYPGADYHGYPEQKVWRLEMIKSLESFQKTFGWEKD